MSEKLPPLHEVLAGNPDNQEQFMQLLFSVRPHFATEEGSKSTDMVRAEELADRAEDVAIELTKRYNDYLKVPGSVAAEGMRKAIDRRHAKQLGQQTT